jgi:phospholipid/cholesterol/gamma-HCH transport system substrate-binding protein
VAKLDVTVSRLNDLLNDDNRHALSHVLANLDQTTSVLAKRSNDIDAILKNTNEATANLDKASANIQPALDHVDQAAAKFGKVADDADTFITGDGLSQLSDLIGDLRRLTTNLNKFSDRLNREPTTLLFGDRRKGYDPNGK